MEKSELIKQLEFLPAFNTLSRSFRKNTTSDNFYIRHFMDSGRVIAVSESGKAKIINKSLEEREDEALDGLLNDNSGYFSEFIHNDNIAEDVTELMRVIFKEIVKCL